MNLSDYIRSIPDWPKKGILFRDITPLLGSPAAFQQAIELLAKPYKNKKIDYVAAVEARGFIFGSAVAEKLNAGFVPIRKKGKLPYKTESFSYGLEYGSDTVEVHIDAVKKDAKVLMIDDLLATGGTMAAACKLIEKVGGKVEGTAFLIELAELNGKEKLADYNISSVLKY
ncbi:MAG: adenine phosphoribosyltransferase [Phycisphaerae bacterium]|jgi:adenine phosphoribosyltransferase